MIQSEMEELLHECGANTRLRVGIIVEDELMTIGETHRHPRPVPRGPETKVIDVDPRSRDGTVGVNRNAVEQGEGVQRVQTRFQGEIQRQAQVQGVVLRIPLKLIRWDQSLSAPSPPACVVDSLRHRLLLP